MKLIDGIRIEFKIYDAVIVLIIWSVFIILIASMFYDCKCELINLKHTVASLEKTNDLNTELNIEEWEAGLCSQYLRKIPRNPTDPILDGDI